MRPEKGEIFKVVMTYGMMQGLVVKCLQPWSKYNNDNSVRNSGIAHFKVIIGNAHYKAGSQTFINVTTLEKL